MGHSRNFGQELHVVAETLVDSEALVGGEIKHARAQQKQERDDVTRRLAVADQDRSKCQRNEASPQKDHRRNDVVAEAKFGLYVEVDQSSDRDFIHIVVSVREYLPFPHNVEVDDNPINKQPKYRYSDDNGKEGDGLP
jgi:hypothetical protein